MSEDILKNKTFLALSKRYAGLVQEMIANAPPGKLDPKTGNPTAVFTGEIVQAISVQFQKEFTVVILKRLASGGTVRDAVRNAQKDFDVQLDERTEAVMIEAMEKSFEDEKRKKEEGGIPVEVVEKK